jgi:hypothetical protein
MKYLVVKAWLGFGDRLESLKMAILFAKQYKLKIYVDWSDTMWSHGNENFYTYFKLQNIDQISSLDEIPEDATIYPEYWKGKLHEKISQELLNSYKEKSPLDIGLLNKDYNADVVVFSSIGYRTIYPDSTQFGDIIRVVDPRIINKIRDRLSRYDIQKSWGIHIRGTDRLKPNKRSISVQSIVSMLVTSGGLNGKKMTVVSDDKESIAIWKRFFPDSFIVSELSLQQNTAKGNHNVSKDELNASKDEMNVDALVDFFTLALTERIFTTCKDSRFSHEARRLGPVSRKILGL